jgi:NAD/NADP transhydrogenase beta subunit
MANVNLNGFGYQNSVDIATNTTLALATHSGNVANVTATCALTLPAVAVGHEYIVRVGAPDITVTISPNASDKISGAGAASSGAGADDKDVIFTSQPVGSFVRLTYMSADGWAIVDGLGTYTFEG